MPDELSRERADILEALTAHRGFLRQTIEGMSPEQIRTRSTVSELTLGSIVKHVTATEAGWAAFARRGPAGFGDMDPEQWAEEWRVPEDATAESLLAAYAEVAAATDALVRELDLDADHPLPEAPWFPPDGRRSVRRVWIHIVAETAQHAGHADIVREAIDGQKTMG